jgi:hypothetical protein
MMKIKLLEDAIAFSDNLIEKIQYVSHGYKIILELDGKVINAVVFSCSFDK